MKEITAVFNCQITVIEKVADEHVDALCNPSEEQLRAVAAEMKKDLNADDVLILDHKVFVMDKTEGAECTTEDAISAGNTGC